ncbi:type II secretion system protein GspE [Desulfofundulus thermobenzoicus]|uniref:Type II secretion system protein GspE n=1 Tax=Desulfofundulus thermobenzoicus TaxID=29376 RepID=A0A6N7IMB9_9FIRM|nr:GspE/PulE family protein [Desulfofundulus thermobenzoicus]MQL51064.1 type II secretion system protein GspE [Desulfofundulus thermobenzoicus]
MAVYKQMARLGELLVKKGLVKREDIAKALEEQKKTGEKLGAVLVKNGVISADDLAAALAAQFNIGKCRPGFWNDPPAVDVPVEIIKKHRVFPVRVEGNRVYLAMSDPFNIAVTDEVRFVLNKEAVPEIAPAEDIERAIHKWYGDEIFNDGTADDEVAEEIDDAEGPAARAVQELIDRALLDDATDIHIEPRKNNCSVRYRIDGILHDVTVIPKSMYPQVVTRIKVMAGLDIAERRLPQDGQIRLKTPREVELRVATLATIYGEKITLRILDKTKVVPKLENLGYGGRNLALFKKMLHAPGRGGMIIMTGPTGSGKTTTLYAAIMEIYSRDINIVTVEDPPEYEIDGISQTPINRKAGLDFAPVLRAILRHDPDVIMLGEIRDEETAQLAIRAAMTGHLVLSTLHTNDAASAPARLIEMGVKPYLVASTLRCVIAQRLIRVNCPKCSVPYALPADHPALDILAGAKTIVRGKGCLRCNKGYKGRTAVMELMPVTQQVRKLICDNAPVDMIRKVAVREGMVPLLEDVKAKVLAGVTTPEEMMRIVALAED